MSSSTSKTPVITPQRTMRSHNDWVNGIMHLPDGQHIITFSWDGLLRLWNLKGSAQIGEGWRDGSGTVWSVALSPNGKTIARGSGDYKVRLWDVGTRKDIANWTGHTSAVHALCWSGDSKQAVSGSRDGTARVWDVDSGKTILILKNGYDSVDEVMYSSNS